jgi:uncharacterized small protein (DUF1192 family)
LTEDIKVFVARLKRDIARWKADLTKASAARDTAVWTVIAQWIAEGERLVADLERNNTSRS